MPTYPRVLDQAKTVDPTGTYAQPVGAWTAGTYSINQVTIYSGSTYRSRVNGNTATPGTDAAKWESWGGGSVAGDGPSVEGLVLHSYGNSIPAGFGTTTGAKYPSRVIARRRMTLTDHAASATWMQDIAGLVAANWTPGATGVIAHLDGVANDAFQSDQSAGAQAGFEGALATCLALFRSSTLKYASDLAFDYTGGNGWAVASSSQVAFGTAAVTSTLNDYVDLTFTGANAQIILWNVDDAHAGFSGTTYTVKNTTGSTTYASGTTSQQCVTSTYSGGKSVAPTIVHLTGFASGTNTVRIKNTGTGKLVIGGLIVPLVTPPTVVVAKGVYAWPATFSAGVNSKMDTFNALVDTVVAQFPVDGAIATSIPGTTWTASTMVSADGLHPNDKGEGALADNLDSVLLALPFRVNQNGVTSSAYTPPTQPTQPAAAPGNLPGGNGYATLPTVSASPFLRVTAGSVGGVSDGGRVTTLSDIIGARNFTANTLGPIYRTSGIGGKPTFEALSATQAVSKQAAPGSTIAGPWTFFMVVKHAGLPSDTTNGNYWLDSLDTGNRIMLITGKDTDTHVSLSTHIDGNFAMGSTNAHVVTFVENGASSLIRVDGSQVATGTETTKAWNGWVLFGLFNGTSSFTNGYLADIIAYNAALNNTDCASVEATLKAFYGTP